jgi:hypothetical protein
VTTGASGIVCARLSQIVRHGSLTFCHTDYTQSRDFLVWLALAGVSRVVPLALVEVAVAIALLVPKREPTVPSCHVAPR